MKKPSSSALTIIGSFAVGLAKTIHGSLNARWDSISVEQASQRNLNTNQFWHGVTLVDPIAKRNITDPQEAFEYLTKAGMIIKRGEHRPDVGSKEQRSRTPDMGTYLTKSINEARWYSYPFVSLVEIPYDRLKYLMIDEDILGSAATKTLNITHRMTPVLRKFEDLANNAFVRMASNNPNEHIPGSFMNETVGDILKAMHSGDINAYINDYSAIGKFMNAQGLSDEERQTISTWTNMGELDIENFFMPTSIMPEIKISELYYLNK